MDQEGADRGRYRPHRQLEGRQRDPEACERALDQQDRRDREENILAEEQPDIVGGRRHRFHMLRGVLVELAVLLLRGGDHHRRDERPHGLRMPRDRSQAERGEDLADREIDDQQPARGRAANAGD